MNDQSYDPKYERWILVFCMFLFVSSFSLFMYILLSPTPTPSLSSNVVFGRDLPKQRRKPITRHERKDKTVMIETEDEEEHDTEIKTEGGESTDERIGVELAGEVAELPRK